MAIPSIEAAVAALGGHLGIRIRDERRRRAWTLRELAERSGVSRSQIQWLEAGHVGSVAAYVAVSRAFGHQFEADLVDPRAKTPFRPAEDPVHAAMGEFELHRLGRPGVRLAVDEPYQHFQFAGRGDVVAWTLDGADLLHLENRTRFPNLQEAFGSYNAKRRWLASAVAERLGLRHEFRSVTHAMVALWSSEVLHVMRIREASFRAVCPSPTNAFRAWWDGEAPPPGVHSCLIVLDPLARGRADQQRFIGLEDIRTARPRWRGYADALEALRASGRA